MSTRVLIIDPNIPFMVSLKQALEGTGEFEVSVSANGLAAQDVLRQSERDIAVIDFNVADMDALELIAQMRRIQPHLRFLLSYTSDEQADRAPHLGVHGTIGKPYTARELIVQIYRSIARRVPDDTRALQDARDDARADAPPDTPAPAPFIEMPDDEPAEDAAPFEAARFAGEQGLADPSDDAPTADDLRRIAQTHILRDELDPADTDALHEWQDIDRTGTLPKTDALGDTIERHGWIESDATPPFVDDTPPREDDTPTVLTQDLNGVRQFLATDAPGHDPAAFGEVLDALAQAPPSDTAPSPHDQAFHELVDSLRTPASPPRRGKLEDLLTSLGGGAFDHDAPPDAAPEPEHDEYRAPEINPLDYVLDSIRRGQPAPAHEMPDDEALDDAQIGDATIGEVIGGLFDSSFESVLAGLAGKDVADDDYAEPTYSDSEIAPGDSFAPDLADQIGLDDFDGEDAMPDWLARLDMPSPAEIQDTRAPEPPIREDDSTHYPATAALHAVADEEQQAGFSLNDLLSQIEQQLPPARDQRPRLRPLPSWEENASPEEAEQLRQVFPDEVWESGDVEEIFSTPVERAPHDWDEPVADAREPLPAEARDAARMTRAAPQEERLGAEWDAFADEAASGEALPADFRHLLDQVDEPEPVERDEPDRMALELDLDEDLIDAAQRAEAENPFAAALPAEEDTLATEITEAFYEGVRQSAYDWDQADTPAPAPVEPAWEAEPEAEGEITGEPDYAEYADPWHEPPARSHRAEALVELPVEEAARLLAADPEPEAPPMEEGEAARLAQIALQLTQFSLESSAQATVLTYDGELIAQAGDLPGPALERLDHAIETAWSTSPPDYDSLTRFVTLPGVGEFLLFSMVVADDMALSMVFNASTPVRTIRRQARRLSESLALVPEQSESPEPPAAITRPARPTDLRAPEGLRATPAPRPQPAPAPARPARAETPYAGYTLLWLPWDPRLELRGAYAEALRGWIESIAAQRAWDIDALTVETDYVQVAVKVPQKNLPDGVLHTLFDETVRRTEEHFPELVDGAGRLWAAGYYVVTPPRALSDREIGRFITYQRQVQAG